MCYSWSGPGPPAWHTVDAQLWKLLLFINYQLGCLMESYKRNRAFRILQGTCPQSTGDTRKKGSVTS